jgi:hypothetical protein
MCAVEAFKALEQEDELFEVMAFEAVVLAIQRMGNRVRQLAALDIFGDKMNIAGPGLQGGMIGGVQAPDQQVNLAAVSGKETGDFLAGDDIGAIGQRQHAVDGVVIGDGDPIHAAGFGLGMDGGGLAVTFGTRDSIEDGFRSVGAGDAMAMKIDSFIHKRSPNGTRFGGAVKRNL